MEQVSTESRARVTRVRVVVLRERAGADDLWVAQCLDYDINAQGATYREMLHAFERTFATEIVVALEADREPLADIAPAPKKYWDLWEQGARMADTIPLVPMPEMSAPRVEAEIRLAP